MKNLSMKCIFFILLCTTVQSCLSTHDDGKRAFYCMATVYGDSINGYACRLNGGGWVLSREKKLEGITRGLFTFYYNESDWMVDADNRQYIGNAQVSVHNRFLPITPVSLNEALRQQLLADTLTSKFNIGMGYIDNGYIDLSVRNVLELEDSRPIDKIRLIYDNDVVYADTLALSMLYDTHKMTVDSLGIYDANTASIDLSALGALHQWADSVVVRIQRVNVDTFQYKVSRKELFHEECPFHNYSTLSE